LSAGQRSRRPLTGPGLNNDQLEVLQSEAIQRQMMALFQ
jgi:hypothetical protein